MTNETMSAKEMAWKEYRNGDHSLGHKEALEFGFDACAKRAIDKEKLVEWLVDGWKTAEDHYDLTTILKGKIESGEFDLK